MAWVEPPDFVADETLAATDLQKLSDNQSVQGDAWTPYTPVWDADGTAPDLGNGIILGAYRQVGKTVNFWVDLTFGSSTSNGTGDYFWTLPVTAKSGFMGIGAALIFDVSAASGYFSATVSTSLNGLYARLSNGSGDRTSATVPMTPASGDSIRFSGTYEAA